MKGLRLPKELIISASGIDKKVINDDIKQGKLIVDKDDKIWYQDALNYVSEKWNEGKTTMYEPYLKDGEGGFAARVLSRLDDQLSVGNLEMKWVREYQE